MKVDWTFKVSDVLRIITVAGLAIIGYMNLSNQVQVNKQDIVELKVRQQKTDEALQTHIQREAELAAKAVEVMNRMLQTMESFPPHRHTQKGEIIYPKGSLGEAIGGRP